MGGEPDHIMDRDGLCAAYIQCVETQNYHASLRQQHTANQDPNFFSELNKRTGN